MSENKSVNDVIRDYNVSYGDPKKKKQDLISKFEDLKKQEQRKRSSNENIWKLCVAFLSSEQWLKRDKLTKRVIRENPRSRPWYRARVVYNKIRGVVDDRLAKHMQGRPAYKAVPASQDMSDIRSAKMGESLLTYLYRACDCEKKLMEVLVWSFIGQGYWEVKWDNTVGEEYQYVEDGKTKEKYPINTEEAQALIELGAEIKTTHAGEIDVEVITPFQLYTFGSKDPQEAHTCIKVKGYTQEEVYNMWGKKIEPNGKSSLDFSTVSEFDNGNKDLVVVTEVFVPKMRDNPDGFYMAYAGDEILHKGEYPYKSKKMPFFKFSGGINPAKDYDDSLIWNLIPMQQQLNTVLSQIVEFKNLTLYPQVYVPAGFNQKRSITAKPGDVIEYPLNPMAKDAGMPQDRVQPSLPQYIYTHVDKILEAFSDISGEHKIGQGETGRVDSAFGIELLMENENNRLTPYVRMLERTISQVGQFKLALAQERYTDERLIEIVGSTGLPELRAYRNSDLSGIKDVYVQEGSMAPKSSAAKGQLMMNLFEQGAIDPKTLIANLDSNGTDALNKMWQADKERSSREINNLLETGEPIPDPEVWDDDFAHIEVMDMFAKSEDWDLLDDDQKELFKEHYELHSQRLSENEQQQMLNDKMRLALNIQQRGVTDPELLAGVMKGAGVDLDAEALAANEDADVEREHEKRIDLQNIKSDNKQEENAQKQENQMQMKALEAKLDSVEAQNKAILEEASDNRKFLRDVILKSTEKDGEPVAVIPTPTPDETQQLEDPYRSYLDDSEFNQDDYVDDGISSEINPEQELIEADENALEREAIEQGVDPDVIEEQYVEELDPSNAQLVNPEAEINPVIIEALEEAGVDPSELSQEELIDIQRRVADEPMDGENLG